MDTKGSLAVGWRVDYYCRLINICTCFFFFPISLTFFFYPPLGPSISVLSVVSSLTRQLGIGLLVFCLLLALCPHRLLVCLPSVRSLVTSLCWSIRRTYHTTDRTSKRQPCPRYSTCAQRLFPMRFRFLSFRF